MGLVDKVKTHEDKLKKESNNDNFRSMHNPGTHQGHRSMTSHFNVINKCGPNVSNQGNLDSDK